MTYHPDDRSPGRSEAPGDWGPPDWFAAVAEPEPGAESEPASAREPSSAPRREPGPGSAAEPASGPGREFDLSELTPASQLPGGRRRRRSALAEEAGGPGTEDSGVPAEPVPAADARRQRRSERRQERAAAGPAADPAESADPETRAREICLRLLTGAAKTRKQLGDALLRREIPEEVAELVLDRFEEVGLIDDGAFAEAWVDARQGRRGRRALAQELRTKGVAGELVERAVAQVDDEDETDAARALVDRKLRSTRGVERQARIRRLVAMLARRGYPEGLAFRVVLAALAEEGSGGAGGFADAARDGAGDDGEHGGW
ncbi:regulatory protein RecX [Kitasatospora sp. NPDC094015]|uniref:regulatory protein RecX n=1 Tax=Kitasatospora sp. NPDC094015 TaxID=3155205 RepID=UPI0033247088